MASKKAASKVGRYRGHHWRWLRDKDVFPHLTSESKSYHVIDTDGEPTGDHFLTIAELENHIDLMIYGK